MDKVKLCSSLEQTTYVIKAYENDEPYSEGSGFCINKNGFLITAAHVVTGRTPIREEDYLNENVKIVAKTKKELPRTYKVICCGITINWPDGPFKEPIQIDLAILRPIDQLINVPFLEIEHSRQPIGTEVLMAGFPDELEFPLQFDKSIDHDYLKTKQSQEKIEYSLEHVKGLLLMMKSGMIGYSDGLNFSGFDGTDFKLNVNVFYVDNVMHSGASGGPVINKSGKVVGVITKRAVTRVPFPDLEKPMKEVPSGSALAVSAHTIVDYVNYKLSLTSNKSYT